MRILMITPYLPYPLYSGGQIRTYHLLRSLAQKHEITLFSFIRNNDEKKHALSLAPFCGRIVVFKRRKAWSPINMLLAGFSFFPFLVAIYYSHALRRAITEELRGGNYDLIHAETFYVMPNIPKTKVPVLLVEQTIEFQVYQHFVEQFPWFILRPFLFLDVLKIRFWERHFWQKAERVVAMSEADRRVMLQVVSGKDVDIVPNGVDLTFFRFRENPRRVKRTVAFVGNFNWLQNQEAVRFLVMKIWPLVIRRIPDAQLLIAGRNPSPEIRGFAGKQIEVLPDVGDIRSLYRRADVLVASMLGRGGTRFKILEAMASGVPVVATAIGIEGIRAEFGREVMVRNRPREIASAVEQLFRDLRLYGRIARAARKLIETHYAWDDIASRLDSLYEKVGKR